MITHVKDTDNGGVGGGDVQVLGQVYMVTGEHEEDLLAIHEDQSRGSNAAKDAFIKEHLGTTDYEIAKVIPASETAFADTLWNVIEQAKDSLSYHSPNSPQFSLLCRVNNAGLYRAEDMTPKDFAALFLALRKLRASGYNMLEIDALYKLHQNTVLRLISF